MVAERISVIANDTRARRIFIIVASSITILMLAFAASRFAVYQPIDFNEAYNLEVAKSIGSSFCYCTAYHPKQVFPVGLSTQGVIQYVGGVFFALTHNVDSVKAGTAAVTMLFLGAVLLAVDPWLPLLGGLLFLFWPELFHVSTDFVGELWATGFVLLGIVALRKCDFSAPLRSLLTSYAMLYAAVCFGLAIESKLLAVIAIFPIVLAISYSRDNSAAPVIRALRASCVTATAAAGTLLSLLLLVAFSVIHSMRTVDLDFIWQTFTGYIFVMVRQGPGQAQPFDVSHVTAIISGFDSRVVLSLFILSSALLLYVNWAYVIFLVVTLTWWLHYGGDERHLVISVFLAIILGGWESHRLIKRISESQKIAATKISLAASAALVLVVWWVANGTHNGYNAFATLAPAPDRDHVVQTAHGQYHYSDKLIEAIRTQQYVVTSGFWQLPEISIRQNVEFYDRASASNADLPRDHLALLFDKTNTDAPLTSVKGNCDRILYAEGPLVLCSVKRSIALNFSPPGV